MTKKYKFLIGAFGIAAASTAIALPIALTNLNQTAKTLKNFANIKEHMLASKMPSRFVKEVVNKLDSVIDDNGSLETNKDLVLKNIKEILQNEFKTFDGNNEWGIDANDLISWINFDKMTYQKANRQSDAIDNIKPYTTYKIVLPIKGSSTQKLELLFCTSVKAAAMKVHIQKALEDEKFIVTNFSTVLNGINDENEAAKKLMAYQEALIAYDNNSTQTTKQTINDTKKTLAQYLSARVAKSVQKSFVRLHQFPIEYPNQKINDLNKITVKSSSDLELKILSKLSEPTVQIALKTWDKNEINGKHAYTFDLNLAHAINAFDFTYSSLIDGDSTNGHVRIAPNTKLRFNIIEAQAEEAKKIHEILVKYEHNTIMVDHDDLWSIASTKLLTKVLKKIQEGLVALNNKLIVPQSEAAHSFTYSLKYDSNKELEIKWDSPLGVIVKSLSEAERKAIIKLNFSSQSANMQGSVAINGYFNDYYLIRNQKDENVIRHEKFGADIMRFKISDRLKNVIIKVATLRNTLTNSFNLTQEYHLTKQSFLDYKQPVRMLMLKMAIENRLFQEMTQLGYNNFSWSDLTINIKERNLEMFDIDVTLQYKDHQKQNATIIIAKNFRIQAQ